MRALPRAGLATLLAAVLSGCATSSHELIGTARPPVAPDSVIVYTQRPARYEEIATVNATSELSLAITTGQNEAKAIARLKAEAARLGANGILLQSTEDSEDQPAGAVGGSVGKAGAGYNAVNAGAAGGWLGFHYKDVTGLAIWVLSEE